MFLLKETQLKPQASLSLRKNSETINNVPDFCGLCFL